MIRSISSQENFDEALDKIGLRAALHKNKSVLLKINLARPPEPGHPRTDPVLLANVIQYFVRNGARCAIAEGANGFLQENLERVGLERIVKENKVTVIDLDLEDFEPVVVDDQEHYLPRCLKDYAIRIGMPALSKRPDMLFSNNVKLFVGAVPRRMYQIGEPTTWRPRVHLDLHRSVANIYQAVMKYAPFHFFINGGRVMIEDQRELEMQETLIGDDAVELDQYFLRYFNVEVPEYISRLSKPDPVTSANEQAGSTG